ncbi:MAG: Fic family protein, partial [Patescibacteria group bacterium]
MFIGKFLSDFSINWTVLPLKDEEITALDKEVESYEAGQTNPDIENNLYRRNEFFASFAISKAENSQLTFKEAEDVYRLVIGGKKLTQKDHDKVEFFNIVKTFREINSSVVDVSKIDVNFIKKLHLDLTKGLDIYRSGKFRDNDLVRVGNYAPVSYKQIEPEVKELLLWLKKNLTIANIGFFHVALYALHPFSNGNKRVCRILEHVLLRS